MTTEEPEPRRPRRPRDPQAAAERRAAESRAEYRAPGLRATRALEVLRQVTTASRYAEAPELYGVLIRLTQLTDVTEQVLDQARQWLTAQNRAGQLATIDGGDVGDTIEAITAAMAQARVLSAAIDAAAGHAGHITGGQAPDVPGV